MQIIAITKKIKIGRRTSSSSYHFVYSINAASVMSPIPLKRKNMNIIAAATKMPNSANTGSGPSA